MGFHPGADILHHRRWQIETGAQIDRHRQITAGPQLRKRVTSFTMNVAFSTS